MLRKDAKRHKRHLQTWFSLGMSRKDAKIPIKPLIFKEGLGEVMDRKKVFNISSQKQTRRMLRNNMPEPEIILWSKLKSKQLLNVKFRRQYSIEKFVVDFYCPEYKLAIEIDGENHFSAKMQEKDIWRQKIIEKYGIRFLRFTNKDITENLNGVVEKIVEHLNLL
jgi:very-short-patch-repair endonuclease